MKINKVKKMKRKFSVLFAYIAFISISSCDQDFEDINNAWDSKLYKAEVSGLFNGLVSSMVKTGQHHRIPTSWLHQWNQSAAMYAASGYRLDDNVSQPWENFYKNMANYIEMERLIEEEDEPANRVNTRAMAKIIMSYKAINLALLYGDMPFTEAGRGFTGSDGYRPKYDTQQVVIETALTDLGVAMNSLSSDAAQISLGSSETLFGNDLDKWKKFANSLRLKYAMVIRDKDAAFADPIISDALSKPLLAPDETFSLDPSAIPDLEINRGGYYRGNAYIRMGSTMWEAMSSDNAVDGSGIFDLRTPILFEPNEDDEWVPYPQNPDNNTASVTGNPHVDGRINGGDWNVNRSNFATLNVYYTNIRTIPQILVSGSEISFIKAELYNRGVGGVTADATMAETNYNEGITASVNYWFDIAMSQAQWIVNKPTAMPTTVEIDVMLANTAVAYDADATMALSQIYKQSWIALFHQPFDSWNLQRRTGNATPFVTPSPTSLVLDFNRLTYPASEREANRENWKLANGGSDLETDKTWFQQ